MSEIIMDFRQPAADYADHFSFFYAFAMPGERFETPDRADYAQFRFILSGANGRFVSADGQVQAMPECYLQGPTTGNGIISGEGPIDVVGVGLMPLGWAALVPMDASAAANRLFDAVDLFGRPVLAARDALRTTGDLDARVAIFTALLGELMAHRRRDYQDFVDTVNAWIADSYAPRVDDLVAQVGLSRSQVERRCKRYFGSPPKLLARKYRTLRAAIALTHQDENADDIIAEGFYDQSHFIREMKHFTGMTPAQFAAHPTELNVQIAKRIELERRNPMPRTGVIT
jgi:AraC-like DNA-binding protein